MTSDAERHRLHFGKYKGDTLLEISETDEGLKYLDWLLGQDWLQPETKEIIEEFMDQPHIAAEVERLVG